MRVIVWVEDGVAWSLKQSLLINTHTRTRVRTETQSHTNTRLLFSHAARHARTRTQRIVDSSLAVFGAEEVVHVSEVDVKGGKEGEEEKKLHIMELWHGPTLAFKDLGLQVCVRA